MKKPKAKIKIGDVVRLKSGSPPFTVEELVQEKQVRIAQYIGSDINRELVNPCILLIVE
jgi:uncharacterized protein YodC (DUF2158 family)